MLSFQLTDNYKNIFNVKDLKRFTKIKNIP